MVTARAEYLGGASKVMLSTIAADGTVRELWFDEGRVHVDTTEPVGQYT